MVHFTIALGKGIIYYKINEESVSQSRDDDHPVYSHASLSFPLFINSFVYVIGDVATIVLAFKTFCKYLFDLVPVGHGSARINTDQIFSETRIPK